jgi:predicted RNA-binding Zn-ribbon protein involved in translation (DUF1610 family)
MEKQIETTQKRFGQPAEILASAAICPMPDCGAMVFSYEPGENVFRVTGKRRSDWEFICPECGAEFTASSHGLVFQSVPRDWLLSDICHA